MKYQETLDWLFGLEARGIKFGLSNITDLLERMGNPHLRYRTIHVAGTNGKGSVCAIIDSVLRQAGYRVGLYTSPHIVDFGERIRVDGVPLPHEDMLRLASEVRKISEAMALESPEKRMTFFELTTAMAFARFAEEGVDWAVVEVGMGGRLDATNVIVPEATVITRIGIEHTEFLGSTLDQIAGEKAGILKPGVPAITAARPGSGLESIIARAEEMGSPLMVIGADKHPFVRTDLEGTEIDTEDGLRLRAPIPGRYQAENMALAYEVLRGLGDPGLTDEVIVRGFGHSRWPGRLEIVSRAPTIILDATHTGDGARVVSKEVREMVPGRIILVIGVLDDKDLVSMSSHFGSISDIAIATSPRSKRSFPVEMVRDALADHCTEVLVEPDVGNAMEMAMSLARPSDTVLVTGSLYTLGEARRWLDAR